MELGNGRGKRLILAIETSCDETAAAVVQDGRLVLSNEIYTQIETHRLYGGVVPEIASRDHVNQVAVVARRALETAGAALADIDLVAATYGPGLVGALLVGLSFAKGLAYAAGKPFCGVHHIKGHIAANYLGGAELAPPFACLIVSGGHTTLARVDSYDHIEILGQTRDDAAGEAFDKAARALGLPYPGGAEIDKLARSGDAYAVNFPKAKLGDGLDFSFSGLKTSVRQRVAARDKDGGGVTDADMAASFQRAVVEALTEKAMIACGRFGLDTLALAGGVASNTALRAAMGAACEKADVRLFIPPPVYCTDNAAMIAAAAYFHGGEGGWGLNAAPSLGI